MRYYQAQDTFIAANPDGTERLVPKGTPLPETDDVVKLDLAACQASKDRIPLFRLLDPGEPEAAPARPSRAARAKA